MWAQQPRQTHTPASCPRDRRSRTTSGPNGSRMRRGGRAGERSKSRIPTAIHYVGTATAPDPHTGQLPEGSSLENYERTQRITNETGRSEEHTSELQSHSFISY